MLSRRTPAWINDPEIRRAFRGNSSKILKFTSPTSEQKQTHVTLSRFLPLGVHSVAVPQDNHGYAIIQETHLCKRDFPAQATGDLLWHMLGEIKPIVPGHKYCSQCGDLRTLDKFSPHPKTRDGLQSYCKGCHADRQRRWRATQRQVAA